MNTELQHLERIDTLSEQVDALKAEIQELRAENERLQKRFEKAYGDLIDERAGLHAENKKLRAELIEAHTACDGSAIRNEKDGYPEGRLDRVLTLPERIQVMRTMINDYLNAGSEKQK